MPYLAQGSNVVDTKHDRAGSTRRFGVELEVSTARNYGQLEGQTVFGLKGDCSVGGDGCEFVSPVLQGDAGIEAVEALCEYARSHEWKCDDTCGYHLHIDMNDLDDEAKKRILYAYKLTEALWAKFVQRRRARNTYCRKISLDAADIRDQRFESSISDIEDAVGRYCWCNTVAWHDHGTLEIRLHHGTVTQAVVVNWIRAHLRFVDLVRSLTLDQIDSMFLNKSEADAMAALEHTFDNADLVDHFRKRVAFHTRRTAAAV